MQLIEHDDTMLECEKEENIKKYTKKTLNLKIDEKDVKVDVFNKIQDKEKNIIIESLNKNGEENEVSNNKYTEMANNKSKSIGVVMYMQDHDYSEKNEENLEIHIKEAKAPSFLAKIIKFIFENLYEVNIIELVMGHEHGEKNNKCHLQIIIIFEKLFRKLLKPGALKIKYDDKIICLLYMQQKTKNAYALKNYCKKERDATIVRNNEIKKFDIEEDNPFIYIRENRNKLTIQEGREKILEYDAELYFRNSNNMDNALKQIIIEQPPVPFQWMPIPEYLKNFFLPDGSNFYETFSNWFQTYCINGENLDRKKALCLYSRKRSMGKSYFVRHLVSHPDYILEFNNTLCWKKNINKGIYKLLLLDDMNIINSNNKAMWKSLVASEPTTLRGAWLNEEFTERLPCIITTNDLEMVKIFRDDKLFNTQVFIIEITKYMGAPGTERLDLMKNEFILSDETVFELNKLDTKKVYSDNLNL